MRVFYVSAVKRYVFFPAVIVFFITLALQFIQPLFMRELAILASIKTKLGYPVTFFPNNTLLVLRMLFSLFYAFIAGIAGVYYYRFTHRKAGNTILLSEGFHGIAGVSYLFIVYALLHSELFVINPVPIPVLGTVFSLPSISTNVRSLFIPQVSVGKPGGDRQTSRAQKGSGNAPGARKGTTSTKDPYALPIGESGRTNTNSPKQTTQKQQPPAPPRQATAQELFAALNTHRARNERTTLAWDNTLTAYSQARANLYAGLGATDNHTGFRNDTEKGLNYKFFFFGLGENSSYGAVGDARYIIEDWFGKSPPHNNNQLNSSWTHVGIGVNGKALNFVFGGGKTDTFHVDR